MKKDNLILLLLASVLLVLGYHSYLLRQLLNQPLVQSPAGSPEAHVGKLPEKQANPFARANLKAEILTNQDRTFGYQILLNGSPIIRQPNIPGLPGNAGFSNQAKAMKTAGYILQKVRRNEMPPSVTVAELDSLGVL